VVFIVAHGYAHRLLNNGIVESTKVREVRDQEGQTIYAFRDPWQAKLPSQMDLSGGDFELIRLTLDRFRAIFFDDGPRTPRVKEYKRKGIDPLSPV
jgi:hypothetical protein